MKKMFNEGNKIHNFMSSSGSGTVINYGSGFGSDFLTSYGSGSTSQKVTVPTVPVPFPVPQHCFFGAINFRKLNYFFFLNVEEKNLGQFSKNYRTLYSKNCH